MKTTSYNRCKRLMIFFNIIFLLAGSAMLAAGIWVVVDWSHFSETFQTADIRFPNAAYIMIIVGSLALILSFLGCVGAWKESRCILTMFTVFLGVLFCIEIAVLVLILAFPSNFQDIVRTAALKTIKNQYGTSSVIGQTATTAWDFTQSAAKCCGYNNGTDYTGSKFDSVTSTAQPWPLTCCTLTSTGGYVNTAACLNYRPADTSYTNSAVGCYSYLLQLVYRNGEILGGVTAGIMVIQLLAITFSCCVSSHIGKSNKVSALR